MEKILKAISDYLVEIVVMVIVGISAISSLMTMTYVEYLNHEERMEYVERGYVEKVIDGNKVWVKE